MMNVISNPTLINVTFSHNLADLYGGGIFNASDSDPILTNVILWNNLAITGTQIYNTSKQSAPLIYYSDIEGSGGSGSDWDPGLGINGGGNIDVDPLFIDSANDDLHLRPTSPVIDAGNNLSVSVSIDLEGNPRLVNISSIPDTGNGNSPVVDMGAYEVQVHIYLPLVWKSTP